MGSRETKVAGRAGAGSAPGGSHGGVGHGGGGAAQRPPVPGNFAARGSFDVLDSTLLAEVHSINATGVELLVQSAGRASASVAAPAAARELRFPVPPGPPITAWAALDSAQRQRLASQPFLLFGLGLENGSRWRALACDIAASQARRHIAEARPRPVVVVYARQLLQYAWHLARTAPLTAGLVAGMSPTTVGVMRACHVEHLDEMAERGACWLRPRWADAPALWTDMLLAAGPNATTAMARTVALRAVQRAGAALAAAGASGAVVDGRS